MSQRPAKLLKWWTMMTNVYREVKTWNEFTENNHAKADAYPIMNFVCMRVPSINLRTQWLGWEWGKLLSHIHFEYHKMSFYTQFTLLFGEWVRLMVFARREIPKTYQIIRTSKHYVWDILCLFLYAARNKNTYRIWRLVRVWAMEANNQMHWLPWPKVCVFSTFFLCLKYVIEVLIGFCSRQQNSLQRQRKRKKPSRRVMPILISMTQNITSFISNCRFYENCVFFLPNKVTKFSIRMYNVHECCQKLKNPILNGKINKAFTWFWLLPTLLWQNMLNYLYNRT